MDGNLLIGLHMRGCVNVCTNGDSSRFLSAINISVSMTFNIKWIVHAVLQEDIKVSFHKHQSINQLTDISQNLYSAPSRYLLRGTPDPGQAEKNSL